VIADAKAIFAAAVDAVRPEPLVAEAVQSFPSEWLQALARDPRILVVGGGKAGAAMAAGLEAALLERSEKVVGLVNVPEGSRRPLKRIRLVPARPIGSNHPTMQGVAGSEEMLSLLESAGSEDVAICLISGGGSALLPAPAEGISLEDKQTITKLLHASGATIGEMNCVRKHLSRIKGGGLANAFRGKLLVSLIISDVVGDPLDVIASGPTTSDPTTFADALAVLEGFQLLERTPPAVVEHLRRGLAGTIPETLKRLPLNIHNQVIASNAIALRAASAKAESLGYSVLNLGPFVEGDTGAVAWTACAIARSIRELGMPVKPPACILLGGETTVAVGDSPGKGGRNQEFVLAALEKLGLSWMKDACVLSGGTDGEDGPTDAAGAVATDETLANAERLGLSASDYLKRHDSYHFFERAGGLLKTGLTETNVMDVRLILVR